MAARKVAPFAFLLLLGAGAGRTAAAAGSRPEGWGLDRLDLQVEVDPAEKRLRVGGRMIVRLEGPRPDSLSLLLNSRTEAMRFTRVAAAGRAARISSPAAGTPTAVAHQPVPTSLAAGDTLGVEFSVESTAASKQLALGDTTFFASWVERWYPIPARADGEPIAPGAPGATTLRLPEGWRSVSNGALLGTTRQGRQVIERWESEIPVARSFVAAPFASVESVEPGGRTISFYLLRARPAADAQAESLARAIGVMEDRFGAYPYPTYNVAEVPQSSSFAAASEQGFIMVRTSILDDVGASLPLFAHEAAHGWWGNLVRGRGPGAKMLTEALAQYSAVLAIETLEGEAAMEEFLGFSRPGYNPLQCALGYFHIWRQGGDKPLAMLADDPWDHNLSDSKGMWFYHMLRGRSGDEVFFSVLASVLRDFPGRDLDLDELRSRFVAADSSLKGFIGQWLDRTGAPVLRVDWWSVDRGGGIEIEVEQLQTGEPFAVPLTVEVTLKDGTVARHVLDLASHLQRFTLPTPSRPMSLRIDPDKDLLLWRPEYGPRPGSN